MNITLEQIKEDIKSGKCKTIYYSSQTLWWTHLEDDLKNATELGEKSQKETCEKLMNDPKVPEHDRKRMEALYKSSREFSVPLDPSGSPLFEMHNPSEFVGRSEAEPDFFGKHKMDCFLKVHHQNCNGWCPQNWDAVNEYLDRKELSQKSEL